LRRNSEPKFKSTYKHVPDGGACRIYGTLPVKRVTGALYSFAIGLLVEGFDWVFLANLHITSIGHGYTSYEHVDHNRAFVCFLTLSF
jgi:hypothetical protein